MGQPLKVSRKEDLEADFNLIGDELGSSFDSHLNSSRSRIFKLKEEALGLCKSR